MQHRADVDEDQDDQGRRVSEVHDTEKLLGRGDVPRPEGERVAEILDRVRAAQRSHEAGDRLDHDAGV